MPVLTTMYQPSSFYCYILYYLSFAILYKVCSAFIKMREGGRGNLAGFNFCKSLMSLSLLHICHTWLGCPFGVARNNFWVVIVACVVLPFLGGVTAFGLSLLHVLPFSSCQQLVWVGWELWGGLHQPVLWHSIWRDIKTASTCDLYALWDIVWESVTRRL